MLKYLIDFFKESNQNGFGFFVVSVLFYLFVFFLIQFFQHKKRFYLFYCIYALVTGFTLMKYVEGVFFSDFFNTPSGRSLVVWVHYPTQLIGSMMFSFFILDIMQLKKEHPKFVKWTYWAYLGVTPIYLFLWGVQLINPRSYLIDYFHGVFFLPLSMLVFVVGFFLVLKQDRIIKWYILSGMSALFVSYVIITLYSFNSFTANTETLYIFYLGVLIESLLFALAIGLEQKMVYRGKAQVQKKYIEQLEENQLIKESINRTLSDELLQTKSEIEDLSSEAQKERTEKLTIKMENRFAQLKLDALRSQMNPHFIFNALNSIKSYLIENDQNKAIYYLGRFSKLIRGILESSRRDLVTLKDELGIIEMYVEIESDRFKNNIEYVVEIDDEISTDIVLIPSLILQPFVENSIWHGLTTKSGKKQLFIKVGKIKKTGCLQIIVEDNGVGRLASRFKNQQNPLKGQSLGLSIVRDRLEFFSKKQKKDFSFGIHDLKNDETGEVLGTRVIVNLPKLTTKRY
ncbi:sensor histidine kinase [Allomuricauda sp. F6463D]|uniref:sensor histidine kinase n=1 Tax=Allomuricauda sp. F6463D TaxID=2926409 RepID=UPI001FF67D84|nr:histidine kinase [Muricauda sp. F6463D]MCK0161126.1 histidine kinase [Muricauda sp. F6463D]